MGDRMYIQFADPKGKPSAAPGRLQSMIDNVVEVFGKALKAIIPKANPDFDNLIVQKVECWKVEFDLENNETSREIGLDSDGNPIVAMPLGNNYGLWTDNNLTLEDYESFNPTRITAGNFEKDWQIVKNKIKHLPTQ
jgi:hypothetical protein